MEARSAMLQSWMRKMQRFFLQAGSLAIGTYYLSDELVGPFFIFRLIIACSAVWPHN